MVISMIGYIKNYGISNVQYEYILRDLKKEYLDILDIEEENIKEVLAYYNELGIKESIYNIIMKRFDLIINSKDELETKLAKIDIKLLRKIVKENIDSLVMFGI
ncbi:unknown [Firmicutes bacterium CAG:582]|nr:unknown [Firmicutes bacterium CAG:582]